MKDPIGGFERIRDLYITYLETAFRIRDDAVSRERRALLERPGHLCTEPLIEPIPRYESVGFRLHELVNTREEDDRLPGFTSAERTAFVDLVLSGLFESQKSPPGSEAEYVALYPLYKHQSDMLRRGIREGSPGLSEQLLKFALSPLVFVFSGPRVEVEVGYGGLARVSTEEHAVSSEVAIHRPPRRA